MDKNSFINILYHFSASSVAEAEEVLLLKNLYPYCQVLHVLSAKVSKDHGFSNQQQELQLAAIYASDRAVLKEVMNTEYNASIIPNDIDISQRTNAEPIQNLPVDAPLRHEVNTLVDTTNLAEEIMLDLNRLNNSRHQFEKMFMIENLEEPSVVLSKTEEKNLLKDSLNVSHEKSGKSKKERIIELAKARESEKLTEVNDYYPTQKKTKDNTGDSLIDEIASTKKAINPETEKQKNQIEIIDQFIKAQPSIVNSKDRAHTTVTGDFSTIKPGEFGDNIVSETLVDILIKQGKKDKAIEVLKKLIWKFPQKKAYFAGQIEELKK